MIETHSAHLGGVRAAKMRRLSLFAQAVILIVVGCAPAKEGPETVDATGVVIFNEQPVEGATVSFTPAVPDGGGKASQATTDAQGRFAMQTYVGNSQYKSGVTPGIYKVTVAKLDHSAAMGTAAGAKNVLPAKYADAATSGFEQVTAADAPIEVELRLEDN